MAAIHGLATSAEIELRMTAPTNAPNAPGTPILRTVRQSTLPKREHERRRSGSVGHAESSVDELGEQADNRENDDVLHQLTTCPTIFVNIVNNKAARRLEELP